MNQRLKWAFHSLLCDVLVHVWKHFKIPLIWTCFCWHWGKSHWLSKQSETERRTVGGLVKIHFVGCDKWDIPSCIKLPYDTLLGSYPESLYCAPVCRSRPCDSQITSAIKHLKTELALNWRQPGAASQLHPSLLQRGTRPKVWQPGKPWLCAEKCRHNPKPSASFH